MVVGEIDNSIKMLTKYWENQGINVSLKSLGEIDSLKKYLPNDFKKLYLQANGMQDFYPNEMDQNGFLFYPLEVISLVNEEFKDSKINRAENTFIFAEYMHKSWWYGAEVIDSDNYVIGIIPDVDIFIPITKDLSEFIELYIKDSPKLYEYN